MPRHGAGNGNASGGTALSDSALIYEAYQNAEHVTSPRRLLELIEGRPEVISCDTETTGLDFHSSYWLHGCGPTRLVQGVTPFGISLAMPTEKDERIALCWARRRTPLYVAARRVLAAPYRKTWHNARYDLRVCEEAGIGLRDMQDDTLTMSRIWWDRRKKHGLDDLAEMVCPQLCEWKRTFAKEFTRLKGRCTREKRPEGWCNYSLMPNELVGEYAKVDAFVGLVVWYRLWDKVGEGQVYQREMKVLRAILEVEKRGLAFDSKKARTMAKDMRRRIKECKEAMPPGVNPGSPEQVLAALLRAGAVKDDLRLKGQLTTKVEVLRDLIKKRPESMAAVLSGEVLEYRALTKTVNTYLMKLAKLADKQDGIIYTTINPADTKTARMASRDPNLTNIPTLHPRGSQIEEENPTRSCFGPRPHHWWYLFDYSQMELAMFGWYTEDPLICAGYVQGRDLHQVMAEHIFGVGCTTEQRKLSKNITFGVLYGMQEKKLMAYLGLPPQDAKSLLEHYHGLFPSIKTFQQEVEQRLEMDGYVEDWFGKRYTLPSTQAYKGVNRLVQGGCGQAFKEGFLAVTEVLRGRGVVLLPIHDELIIESRLRPHTPEATQMVLDVKKKLEEIEILMNRGRRLRVEVKVAGENWADKQEHWKKEN